MNILLDGREVPVISAHFEDHLDLGPARLLSQNEDRMYQGSIFLGDGFWLTHQEAEAMRSNNPSLDEVIFPVINGQELNNSPSQSPGRQAINFFDWPLEKAEQYGEAFDHVQQLVKPERGNVNRAARRERWWQYAERAPSLYSHIQHLHQCFAIARTTKHLNFSALPTNYVFTDALYVFTTDRWDHYAVVQSTLHEVWARKYSGALETRLRYSPSDCFETFPFPEGLWQTSTPALADIAERYHEHRRALMRQLWLGLTDIYNLFHSRDLKPELVAKVSKKSNEEVEAGYRGLLKLHQLPQELDEAVRDAYGWQDLKLDHDFYEVETLSENDRVRYTISPTARKEVLRRLLALNHDRAKAEQEALAAATPVTSVKRTRKVKSDASSGNLFG